MYENTDKISGKLAPGVYLEEAVPVPEPGTVSGIPLIVGFAEWEKSDFHEYRLGLGGEEEPNARVFPLESWLEAPGERARILGKTDGDGFLEYSVRGFFENGGSRCVVVSLRGFGDGSAKREGLKGLFCEDGLLERIPEASEADLVCVPDLMRKDVLESPASVRELQRDILRYCRRSGDRLAILDCECPEKAAENDIAGAEAFRLGGMGKVLEFRSELVSNSSPADGAAYFPWLRVKNLVKDVPPLVPVPPSGHIAGIFSRSDAGYGVHKAPANEVVAGVCELEFRLNEKDQLHLNEAGINCLRSFPGRGIRVWGARTLNNHIEWRYVNERRVFLTLVRWCERNFDDLVFEANGPDLWKRISGRLGAYCSTLYQQGALKGSQVRESFFLKCDAENNPPESREAGRVVCELGLATGAPAEFVVVRITCSSAGIATTM